MGAVVVEGAQEYAVGVDEGRVRGVIVTGLLALGAGAVLRRWWRARRALAGPRSD